MEKASVDTSNVEEKAEEIIAEAEPPPEVYLYYVVYTVTMLNLFLSLVFVFIKAIMCILKFGFGEIILKR